MKNTVKLSVVAFLMLFVSVGLYAQQQNQQQQNPGCCQNQQMQPMKFGFLPNLTQEQKDKIDKLYAQHQQTTLPMKEQVEIKNKELNLLITSNEDINKKEAKIKEINDLQYKLQTERVKYQSDVRNILTDPQKVEFDKWLLNREKHQNCGHNAPNQQNCQGHQQQAQQQHKCNH